MLFEPVVGGQDLRDSLRPAFFRVVHEPKEPRKISQGHRMAGSRCQNRPPAVEEEEEECYMTAPESLRSQTVIRPSAGKIILVNDHFNEFKTQELQKNTHFQK